MLTSDSPGDVGGTMDHRVTATIASYDPLREVCNRLVNLTLYFLFYGLLQKIFMILLCSIISILIVAIGGFHSKSWML